MANWLFKNSLHRPATNIPVHRGAFVDVKRSAQILEASGYAINRKHDISSRISRLLPASGPAAILLTISNIVVDAVKRPAVRTFSHIFEKQFKRVPPFAKTNAATTIIMVGRITCTAASNFEIFPDSVRSKSCPSQGKAMKVGRIVRAASLPIKTSTRFGVADFETGVGNNHLGSTVAKAKTRGLVFRIRTVWSDYDKPCESSSGRDRFSLRHNDGIDVVVFSGGRTASTICPPRFSQILAGGQGV